MRIEPWSPPGRVPPLFLPPFWQLLRLRLIPVKDPYELRPTRRKRARNWDRRQLLAGNTLRLSFAHPGQSLRRSGPGDNCLADMLPELWDPLAAAGQSGPAP